VVDDELFSALLRRLQLTGPGRTGEWKRAFDVSEMVWSSAVAALASEQDIARDLRENSGPWRRRKEYRSRFLGADADRNVMGWEILAQRPASGPTHLYEDGRVLARSLAHG
jgi:hypothetical protein